MGAGARWAVAVVASAYGVAWQLQNDGLGWTFLSLGHPLLICPLVLWVFVVGIRLLMRRLQADAAGNALKYRGVGTVAIIDDVRAALPHGLDGIYLDLHGAAVAEHADDSEGELLGRLRALVGPDLPIVGRPHRGNAEEYPLDPALAAALHEGRA